MEIKLFEVRDRATCMQVMAVKLGPKNSERERYLLDRSGYGSTVESQESYVVLSPLTSLWKTTYDPYKWGSARTMPAVHQELLKNWDSYESGAVIDVEYVLGETKQPKVSEQFTVHF